MAQHKFSDSGDAYDSCQTETRFEWNARKQVMEEFPVKSGDTLNITNECVVGIAGCWPVAVTMISGKLHQILPGGDVQKLIDDGDWGDEVCWKAAVDCARKRGLAMDPTIDAFFPK